jgi:phosphatidylglycerophosphate synthase
MPQKEKDPSILDIVVGIVNSIVEFYLVHVIKPFLQLHDTFYKWLNSSTRSILDDNAEKIPTWFTANFITYVRTIFVVPCVMLIVKGHLFAPSLIILAVDYGDFLDGVVARYWVDINSDEDLENLVTESASTTEEKHETTNSWIINHRNKTYGGFIDAICDKAFVVPCWITLLHNVSSSQHLNSIQYITLWMLIITETSSGCIRFKAYFTSNGISAPVVKDFDFSTSAVKADHIGKAKQTFEMVGTALFVLPWTRYLGLLFLVAAVPLAYESVRRKVNTRVIYVDGTVSGISHETLKFWKQAKNMGSKLVIGIRSKDNDMIANASASESTNSVISGVPAKLSLRFLDDEGIDFVVIGAGQSKDYINSDVAAAKRCFQIGNDGAARLLEAKEVKME